MLDGTLRYILLILAFSLPAGLVELLVCLFTKHRIFKYILPALTLVLSIILVLYARTANLEGFLDLAYLLLGMVAFFMFVVSLVIGIIFDIVQTKKMRKQNNEEVAKPAAQAVDTAAPAEAPIMADEESAETERTTNPIDQPTTEEEET